MPERHLSIRDCQPDLKKYCSRLSKAVILSRQFEVRMALCLKTLFRKSGPVCSSLVQPWNPSFIRLREILSRPFLCMAFFALAVACASPIPAVAQADVNDVHVTPREATPHDGEKAKTEEIAKDTIVPASLNTHLHPPKVRGA